PGYRRPGGGHGPARRRARAVCLCRRRGLEPLPPAAFRRGHGGSGLCAGQSADNGSIGRGVARRGIRMIYFDNAATSWPKPPGVAEAMLHFLNEVGANPGRSGHRLSVEAGRIVYQTRDSLAELFDVRDPLRIVFAANATEALN